MEFQSTRRIPEKLWRKESGLFKYRHAQNRERVTFFTATQEIWNDRRELGTFFTKY